MAGEMPNIHVGHVETPERSTKLGAKGVGEGGLIGGMGSVWVAVNDALEPLGAKIRHQPFTPERVLDALERPALRHNRAHLHTQYACIKLHALRHTSEQLLLGKNVLWLRQIEIDLRI